jgi:hypothetical protein
VQSATWYRKAAEQGYAKAQNNLGWAYEQGQGVSGVNMTFRLTTTKIPEGYSCVFLSFPY